MRNRKQGFTLIELLIVIAIIGILAAVLIPNLLAARKRANDSATQSYIRNCITAVETERNPTTGELPPSLVGGSISCDDPSLGESALNAVAAVTTSTITDNNDDSFDISATSISGNVFCYDGNGSGTPAQQGMKSLSDGETC